MSFPERHPGTFLSTGAKNGALESEIENREYLSRLRALLSPSDQPQSELLRRLLTLGAEWLDIEQGFLARVDLANKQHVITELSGAFPTISRDLTTDLCKTYCRKVIGEDRVLAINNAEEEGWLEDPAFESFQFTAYLGTSVVVNGELYGTLCFVDDEPHLEPFDEEDAAVVKVLAESVAQVLERRDTTDGSQPTGHELRAVFEESPNMILFHDEEGTIHSPNPRLCEETGYDASELAGMKVWEVDRDVRPRVARRLWRRMDRGELSRWEGTFRRKDGSTFPVEVDVKRLEVDGASSFLVTIRDVTERKQAESERREATQLLKQTLESLKEAVFVVDPSERKIIGCNSSVKEVFGYEKDELMGESTEMLHTSREAYERFGEISEAVLDDEGIFRDEYQMRRKDGQIIDTEHVITPLEDDNWPGGVVSVVRDVSQFKDQQRQFEAVFNQTYQFTGLLKLDGTLIEANDAGLEFGGVTEEEVLGRRIWDTYWFQAREHAREWLRESVERAASGEFVRQQMEVRGAEETRTVDFSLRPIVNKGGEVVMIVAEGRDVTGRKETERKLRKERDLLDRILETSPAAIAVFNTDGNFVEASGRAEEILGLTKDEVTERTYNDPDWNIRGPDGGPMPDEELPFARVMNTGKPVHDVEHRIQWPDGTDRLLSVSGAPLRARHGTLEGAVFHIEDITERRLAEKALRDERDRFATLFHNLPNPGVHVRADEEGRLRINTVNQEFERVFGIKKEDVQSQDIQELIVPTELKDEADRLRQLLLSGARVEREVRRKTADGPRDFRLQVAPRQVEGKPTEGFAILMDITDRKQREEELARRQALLEAQAASTIDGLLAVDKDGRVAFYNDQFLDIWKIDETFVTEDQDGPYEKDLLEEASDLLRNPEEYRRHVKYLYDHPWEESRDIFHLTDGRWIDRYTGPILGGGDSHFGRLWVFRDITEQRRMLERLLEIQEEERRRIDQEIHDKMGGLLTSLQFSIGLARRTIDEDAPAMKHLEEFEGLVQELSTTARSISRKLYPSNFSEISLTEALTSLAEDFEDSYDIEIDVYSEIDPNERFPSLVERTAYWIVQEVLLNVTGREETTRAQIILTKSDQDLYLHILDEGLAPDPSERPHHDYRLESIRKRVQRLNGEARMETIPEEGTRISAILPTTLPFPGR